MSVILSGTVAVQVKNEQPEEAKEVAEQPEEAGEAEEQPKEATAKPKKGKKT